MREVPQSIKEKPKSKLTVDDCVFLCLRKGKYMSFWHIQGMIKQNVGKFYGEPTISASIRNMRKDYCREAYDLPMYGEVIEKRKIWNSKGYEYKLITKGE